ncbi:hypothetical protein FA15DRAFT_652958 [Coprinopsis marcescibilis]|uniref:Mid2 domain-containing protein n=1 Tax=Coprinopsis marcescibilis TaxID=230819 RepID=A0A5C3L692_COPMA|nr:hypothetical protein FA15DRAFT_652958 [Coprinopsis marcescibilis]
MPKLVTIGLLLAYRSSVALCNHGSHPAQSLRNVSIDDQHPSITYIPKVAWRLTEQSDWDAGSGRAHMVTTEPAAYAEFRFTVATFISIDEGPTILIDQEDHSAPSSMTSWEPTQAAQIVSQFLDLPNRQHVVRIYPPPEYSVAVVDFFVYTDITELPNDLSNGTTGSLALPADTVAGVVVGSIGSALVLILAILGVLYWKIARSRKSVDTKEEPSKTRCGVHTSNDISTSTGQYCYSPISYVTGAPFDPSAVPGQLGGLSAYHGSGSSQSLWRLKAELSRIDMVLDS